MSQKGGRITRNGLEIMVKIEREIKKKSWRKKSVLLAKYYKSQALQIPLPHYSSCKSSF